MNREGREDTVRRLMAADRVSLPPGLCGEAMRRGTRALRRGRLARRALWLLLCAAVVAFAVWAVAARPWTEPPSRTTPPVSGW